MQTTALIPGVTPETITLGNGRTATILACPYPTEGPVTDGNIAKYAYAHFVFRWRRGATQVQVGHGTLTRAIPLWPDIPITAEWSPDALARFARDWTEAHLAKFRPPTPPPPAEPQPVSPIGRRLPEPAHTQ